MSESKIYEVIEKECIDCKEKFTISPAEQKFYENKGYEIPRRCDNCRKKKKETAVFVCIDCGKEFEITNSAISYYKRNDLQLPKRCASCRSFKRERNLNNKT